ncbi:hypothetical protein ACJX0J_021829, partial [Zea mays]
FKEKPSKHLKRKKYREKLMNNKHNGIIWSTRKRLWDMPMREDHYTKGPQFLQLNFYFYSQPKLALDFSMASSIHMWCHGDFYRLSTFTNFAQYHYETVEEWGLDEREGRANKRLKKAAKHLDMCCRKYVEKLTTVFKSVKPWKRRIRHITINCLHNLDSRILDLYIDGSHMMTQLSSS